MFKALISESRDGKANSVLGMGERKFMTKNSKCFTYTTAQIMAQLLKLLPKWENSPGNPAPWLPNNLGRAFIAGTCCSLIGQKLWFKYGPNV